MNTDEEKSNITKFSMSFRSTPEKKKVLPVFQRALAELETEGLTSKETRTSTERKEEEEKDKDKLECCLKRCEDYYSKAEERAMNGDYAGSLRQFDLSIRFWGTYLQSVESQMSVKAKKQMEDENREEGEEIEGRDEAVDMEDRIIREISEMEKIKEHKKLGAKIFEAQAQVLLEMERDFDAIVCCKEAIACNPRWSIAYLTLSRAEMNFGDATTALESAKKAFQLDSSNAEIVEHLDLVQQTVTKVDRTVRVTGLSADRKYMRTVRVDEAIAQGQHKQGYQFFQNDCEKVRKRLKKRELSAMLDQIGGKLERLSLDINKKIVHSKHNTTATTTNTTSTNTTSTTATPGSSQFKRFGVLEDLT
ncbi:hypothetical protein RFI_13418 [Reticulomyxa filosa]|uniref:Uncharacterized protein n=1 Tax=Reticulomyxa filosa TaxID=46433 RepID=X6NCQ5_RETFI|nr:hypothetical protein RFI_13418 [Reticulomyxa filosa]|eukprot:ETO23761.1 hypothetical protein RFI_13418 [Reticulomyxa filosa]